MQLKKLRYPITSANTTLSLCSSPVSAGRLGYTVSALADKTDYLLLTHNLDSRLSSILSPFHFTLRAHMRILLSLFISIQCRIFGGSGGGGMLRFIRGQGLPWWPSG